MGNVRQSLSELFDAERNVRAVHARLAGESPDALRKELRSATNAALELPDEDEAALRLTRIAELYASQQGPEVVDALIDIMGAEPFEPRAVAGEVLEAMAYERFKEVALGIERALARLPEGNPALLELPYLVAEVGEGSSVRLISKFLAHKSGEVVASAIEALVELGDPAGASVLGPLVRDQRQVELEDDGAGLVSIGALAEEARELLGELGESLDQGGRAPEPRGGKPNGPAKAGKPRR